jgi:hypothetical protein
MVCSRTQGGHKASQRVGEGKADLSCSGWTVQPFMPGRFPGRQRQTLRAEPPEPLFNSGLRRIS